MTALYHEIIILFLKEWFDGVYSVIVYKRIIIRCMTFILIITLSLIGFCDAFVTDGVLVHLTRWSTWQDIGVEFRLAF